jgi:hypothetical protein
LPILWVLPMLLVLLWLRRRKQTAASGRIAWAARSAFAASILLFAIGATVSGCGGAVGGGGEAPRGTPVGTYALTVTATSGTSSHSIPLSLTVN